MTRSAITFVPGAAVMGALLVMAHPHRWAVSRIMSKLRTALKFIGCLFGGAVCASILLLIVALCVFGLRDSDRFVRFITLANPIAGVLGAIAGAVIFFRSAKRPVR